MPQCRCLSVSFAEASFLPTTFKRALDPARRFVWLTYFSLATRVEVPANKDFLTRGWHFCGLRTHVPQVERAVGDMLGENPIPPIALELRRII